jgi:hypothetical protein
LGVFKDQVIRFNNKQIIKGVLMKPMLKTFAHLSILVIVLISNGCNENLTTDPTDSVLNKPSVTISSEDILEGTCQQRNNVIFFDDFESGNLAGYTVPSGHTPPELTTFASSSPTHSVTLPYPRNNYAMMGRAIIPPISSKIVYLSCKMMKSDLSDMSNTLLMLFSGSVGPQQELVLGFYRDSIYLSIENNSNPSQNVSKNIDRIKANKWYEMTIEYNFSDNKVTFFIDGKKVLKSDYTVSSVDHFYFGDFSTDINPVLDKVLFIDDLKLYKR